MGNTYLNAGDLGKALENLGLALAGANWKWHLFQPPQAAGDGLLTAYDVIGMDLRGTELVVLSACETALGEIQATEGVIGLSKAFQIAGADMVVSSLWAVPDRETRELMGSFYALLAEGVTAGTALRRAKLMMKKKFGDLPLFWGGFSCYGFPDPIASQQRAMGDVA